jgi:beta-glucanase (GH16 family)
MKKGRIVICFVFIPFFVIAQEYELMWEDDFNRSVLDEKYWTIEENDQGGGNNEMQYYRPENITIEQHRSGVNCLVISARRETVGCKSFTSGRLVTRGKVSCKYGKIEARIKLPPTANGLWPAFWMLGEDYSTVGWPRCGEIDIMENVGYNPLWIHGTLHSQNNYGTNGICGFTI